MNLTNSSGPIGSTREERCALPTQDKFQFQTAFLIFILILTFVGNLLVILAVIFFRRLRSITNYFIVSLAVSDILIASISLPFRLDQTVHNAQWCLSYEACITWILTDTICSFASIWNLAIISIDRYFAIVHPFRYHSIITTKVGYGLIGFVWGFSFILALLILMNWTDFDAPHFSIEKECTNSDKIYYTVSSSLSFYLPLLIILFMYGAVFRVAINQAKAMAALDIASNRRGRRSSINLVREVKAAKTLAIVIGCFVICWFPFSVLVQISLWNKALLKPISPKVLTGLSLAFAYVLPAVNSTLNPIIYALFNRDFRQAFFKLAKRITGQRLGAVGLGEASRTGTSTTTANGGFNHRPKGIRFRDNDSESSEALPSIPMRDPKALYNDDCDNHPHEAANKTLAVPHDTNSMETTLDDDVQKPSADIPDSAKKEVETRQSNESDGFGEPSQRDLSHTLPPLETNSSKSTDDDVDFSERKLVKPSTLLPIESTTNDHMNHSPSTARSELSDASTSSLVNVAGNEQKDEDKTSDKTDQVC